ncbi:MAG: hypothetical protein GC150_00985 [Rhizobiales bacterium]|nr:hypothetical protein [Hyphomicrobiales bacterium]
MAHNILGFVARRELLSRHQSLAYGAVVAPLALGLALLVKAGWSFDPPDTPGSGLLGIGARIGSEEAVVLVATAYFGGQGEQGAAVWSPDRQLAFGVSKGAINAGLAHLGVGTESGVDAFDRVGLGWYRRNSDWVAYAKKGKADWETAAGPAAAEAFSAFRDQGPAT